MRLFGKLVTDLTEADLLNLKDNRVSEGQTLDFKRDAYTKSDRDKRELLKDVVGMANASGGVILIGIQDQDDVATDVLGVRLESATEPMQWYSNLILSGVEPRLGGVQMFPVPIGDGTKHVIAIGIPQSLNRPHRYNFDRSQRFTVRHNRDTSDMTYDELRRTFVDGEAITRRVLESQRKGCDDLLTAIDTTCPPERKRGIFVIQVAPLYPGGTILDVPTARGMHDALSPPGHRGRQGARPAFEGIWAGTLPDPTDEQLWGCLQLFRDGRIQGVAGDYTYDSNDPQGFGPSRVGVPRCLGIVVMQNEFVEALPRYFFALGQLGYIPPFGVSASLLNVAGTYIQRHQFDSYRLLRQGSLHFEPALVEEGALVGDWHHIVRPILDQLWNAYGVAACPNYGSDGKWNSRTPG